MACAAYIEPIFGVALVPQLALHGTCGVCPLGNFHDFLNRPCEQTCDKFTWKQYCKSLIEKRPRDVSTHGLLFFATCGRCRRHPFVPQRLNWLHICVFNARPGCFNFRMSGHGFPRVYLFRSPDSNFLTQRLSGSISSAFSKASRAAPLSFLSRYAIPIHM